MMPMLTVVDGYDSLDISLKDGALEARLRQFDRMIKGGTIADVAGRIAGSVGDALVESLDSDVLPPSKKQLRYAAAIAREFQVSVGPPRLHS